ncbi:MAG: ParB/RepB/Spo0J family partition protein, partial [Deltaproteobacteria bacterium]
MDKKKALGRGMASLIPDPSLLNEEATPPKTYFYCDIENIVPNKSQPRKKFNDESLQELADSIREKGILQPILVRRLSEFKFELIAGDRRWMAAQKAGLMQVPVIVRESTTQSALEEALIENIQREDLNPIEEALAYQGLIEEHGYTQEEIAKKIGKQRSTLANSLRLLTLSKAILDLILDRKISSGHAKALLSIEDKEKR